MRTLKLLILIYATLMQSLYAVAQNERDVDLSKALRIGDVFIPPSALQQLPNRGASVNLTKLEGKVVVLDFFDSYCGSCIQSMPRLQKLQNKLKSKLQIINVGWQNQPILEKFYANNQFLKENEVNLPVIYSDVYLKERFPHQTVPHVVFLFNGKVHAITGSDLITEENVLKLFNSGKIDLPLKDDFGKGNLMGSGTAGIQLKGAISLSGYQNGVPFEAFRIHKDSVTGLQKTSMYNVSIYSAILSTWAKIKKADYIPRPERLVLNVKEPNRYEDIGNIGDVWYTQHAISYERLDSIVRPDSAQAAAVLNDLHSFLGIRTFKTRRKMNCLILKPCPLKPYRGKELPHGMVYDGTAVMAVMIDLGAKFPPVLDLVKSKDKITLREYNNIEGLNKQLVAYGIRAEIGLGYQEVLVIEEVK